MSNTAPSNIFNSSASGGSFVGISNSTFGASVPATTVWKPNNGGNISVPNPQFGASVPSTSVYMPPATSTYLNK